MTCCRPVLPSLFLVIALTACSAMPVTHTPSTEPMTIETTPKTIAGDWTSVAPEVRPSAQKNADGSIKPFYLVRTFSALPHDAFELAIVNSADAYGKVPLAKIVIRGHMHWRGEHPIGAGAQKVDFVADEAYEVTPLLTGFADVLNKVARDGYAPWVVGQPQSVFGKTFVPFGLVAGTNFMEHDLVLLSHGMLFWGARHVDGRGFDSEQNRPTNLQIPLMRR